MLVVGWGSPLREDDGAGFAVAARLGPPAIAVVQLTPELAEPLSRAGRVLFLDAERGRAPGDVAWRRVEPDDAGTVPHSHQVTPEGLLAAARVLYGAAPEAWLAAIGGARFGYGETLSPEVEAAVAALVERLRGFDGEGACTIPP